MEGAVSVESRDATAESLRARLAQVERENAELRTLERKHERAREELERAANELRERVKELNCLYRISALGQRADLPLDEIVRRSVEVLPPAWQYHDITSARIVLEGREYRTAHFAEGVHRQAQPILIDGQPVGLVEVTYAETRPPAHEGPFLAEERQLIDAVANAISELVRRAQARAAIDETNAKNRALLAAIPDLIFQLDRSGKLLGFQPGSYTEVAPLLASMVGRNVISEVGDEWLPRRVRERLLVYVERVLTTGAPQVVEQTVSVGRNVRDFEIRLVVSTESVVLGMLRDITEQKRLEKEILEISGREQRRIGRDLHDSLCQHLAGVGFLAKALARRTPPELAGDAAEIVALIDDAITLTRGFARGLHPIQLDAEGLVAGLSELAEHSQRIFGVRCRSVHRGRAPDLEGTVALHLYRLAQEAVSNAIKHGTPTAIGIELDVTPPNGSLVIEDDGVGITAPGVEIAGPPRHGRGMGLSIMRYRAFIIGGSIEIGPASPHGTRVVCHFPLS
ncbi:MAG: hypothetical protein JW751_10390 [Polyangiaceae bacterium]|nr:hypothetical protein [Polyangiaceae bacterium]